MDLRATTPDDLPALRRFYSRRGRADTCVVRDDYYDWQFMRSRALYGRRETTFLAAFDGDEVVAVAVAAPGSYLVNGKRVDGCWHQEWIAEKPGAAFLLMKRQLECNDFLGTGTQNLDSAVSIGGLRELMWTELERLISVVDARKTLEFVFDPVARTLQYLKRAEKFRPPSPDVTCEPVARFDDAYDEHWNGIRVNFSFVLDRSADYLNWRYVGHPIFEYDRVLVRSSKGDAYYVWRREKAKGKDGLVGRICEVIGAPEGIARTFPKLREMLADSEIAFADFSCANRDVNAALVHGGMLPHVLVAGMDLARLFQPVENRPEKRISFSFSFDAGSAPEGIFDYHRAYVTRGESNQDQPLP